MLENSVKKITEGIWVDNYLIYARDILKGRFKEEHTLGIFLKKEDYESRLLYIKVFYGRFPTYRPWVEFFSINNNIEIGDEIIGYFDSLFEDRLLEFFSQSIKSGEKIYVEYINDRETAEALMYDVPPAITRLGYKLFNLGFTWFKDWYFPEGYSEGGQKLQGEKPLNDEARIRQVNDIYSSVRDFIKRTETYIGQDLYMIKAITRAKKILSQL